MTEPVAPSAEERRKFDAEAEARLIEARSTALRNEAEARKLNAEAEKAEHESAKAKIDLERERQKRQDELTDDRYHHQYVFDSAVDSATVTKCRKQLALWERQAGTKPITVEMFIDSPGGGIFEGFALVDYVAGFHKRGNTLNTTAYGMAASMGGVLLQMGKVRRIGASAAVLIHEAQFRAGGKTGAVEDEVELVHMLQDRILDMYADRAKESAATSPMTRATLKNRWRRKDWWIGAPDCLKYGFVDEIV